MLQDKSVVHPSSLPPTARPRLFAEFVTAPEEIKEVQKLRYDVFCEEYNVTLPTNSYWNGHPIDADEIDEGCLHLVVREGQTLEPVGYTRVLTQDLARKLGSFYSAHEFDIKNIEKIDGRIMEIGRTCIHPEHRNGATISVLWSRLAKYMLDNDFQYLFGCASISLADGGTSFASIMPTLRTKHMSDEHLRVFPKLPLETHAKPCETKTQLPPLLKAYMKMGARICGEPCWDPEFNVADVFVVLNIEQVANRYAKRFLKAS
ncbi:MAG: GNAT family N-acetyltransferase [Pseudomonadales bacterium]|nr:GNAT family N-acetyltransferase [Pseudomonadales bacterium]